MNTYATLNIGCGVHAVGHVRVDIRRYDPFFKKSTAANVIADAHYLPFKNTVFNDIKCENVLEHLDNPWQAMKEAIRVGGRVRFEYPRDRWGLLCELLECFYILFKEKNIPRLFLHVQKMFRWKERHSGPGGHKWVLHMKNEKKLHYAFGPLKLHVAYEVFRGNTWMGKPEIMASAFIIRRGKRMLTFSASINPEEASSFRNFLEGWIKKIQKERRSK